MSFIKQISKVLAFYVLVFYQASIFSALVQTTGQKIYAGAEFGGQTTSSCISQDNPRACCEQLSNDSDRLTCLAQVASQEIQTTGMLEPFEYYAASIDELSETLEKLNELKTYYCQTSGGNNTSLQAGNPNEVPTADNPTKFSCSPAGISKFFAHNFFKPNVQEGINFSSFKSFLTSHLGDQSNSQTFKPILNYSFFMNCPGMFYYLCNAMGDECFNDSGKYSITITDKNLIISDDEKKYLPQDFMEKLSNGMKISFFEYVTGLIVGNIPKEIENPPYYDWFTNDFGNEFYQYVVLPFVKIAQQGSVQETTQATTFYGLFGGVTQVINEQSGYLWNILNPKLQTAIKNNLSGVSGGNFTGFPLCLSCNYDNSTKWPICWKLYPSGGLGFVENGLGCLITIGNKSWNCDWAESTDTNLYQYLLNCCAKKNNTDAQGTLNQYGAGFMCDLITAQYNMTNALLESKKAGFSSQELNNLKSEMLQQCSAQQKETLNNCISQNFNSTLQTCISQGKCKSFNDTSQPCATCIQACTSQGKCKSSNDTSQPCATCIQACTSQGKCKSSNDTSQPCATCMSEAINKVCQNQNIQKEIEACVQNLEMNSDLKANLQLAAQAATNVANAKLQFARIAKKYALNSASLDNFCPNLETNPSSCLVDKCYAFCNTSNQINYKDLNNWQDASSAYQKAANFAAQMTTLTYQQCPTPVSAMEIIGAIMTFVGPIMGIGMSFLGGLENVVDIAVQLVLFAVQEAVSIAQDAVQEKSSAQLEFVGLEKIEGEVKS